MRRWWHRPLAASGAVASMVGCSQPAPTAQRARAPETAPSAPSADDAASAGAGGEAPTTLPAPATTTTEAPPTTTVVTVTVPTTPRRTTTTFVLPEAETEETDAEWWASQPGFVPGACGGSLPPCWVMQRESGGNPSAVNATGCGGRGCYGKWQFDPRTSRGLGYARTMDTYPESVQDEAARALWAGGRGCSHWDAC